MRRRDDGRRGEQRAGWPGFDDAALASFDSVWTAADVETLGIFSITIGRVKDAYTALRVAPRMPFPRLASFGLQEEAVLQLSRMAQLTQATCVVCTSVDGGSIVVTGNGQEPEALSTCLVIRHMIQQLLHEDVGAMFSIGAFSDAPSPRPLTPSLVVVITRGLFGERRVMEFLVAAHGSFANVATVLADVNFDFPDAVFLARSSPEERATLQALLKVIALPFNVQASQPLMERQVEELVKRMKGRRSAAPPSGSEMVSTTPQPISGFASRRVRNMLRALRSSSSEPRQVCDGDLVEVDPAPAVNERSDTFEVVSNPAATSDNADKELSNRIEEDNDGDVEVPQPPASFNITGAAFRSAVCEDGLSIL